MLIISGTNRRGSNSYKIAKTYDSILQKIDIEAEILDLCELPRDFAFSALYENSGKSEAFSIFQNKVDQHDKIIFIISEYNGSFPGVLKTFVDGLRYPSSLKNKKSALVGLSSGSMGSALAISHFTDILNYLGAIVLPFKPRLVSIHDNLNTQNQLSKNYKTVLTEQAVQFVEF